MNSVARTTCWSIDLNFYWSFLINSLRDYERSRSSSRKLSIMSRILNLSLNNLISSMSCSKLSWSGSVPTTFTVYSLIKFKNILSRLVSSFLPSTSPSSRLTVSLRMSVFITSLLFKSSFSFLMICVFTPLWNSSVSAHSFLSAASSKSKSYFFFAKTVASLRW